jgi:hypothetical protein
MNPLLKIATHVRMCVNARAKGSRLDISEPRRSITAIKM